MKFSIVIPSFNQGRYVEAALQSVFSQDYQNFEVLFIDGGSTDDTMQRIERFRPHLAHCIFERDRGQSDALEKGFRLATGEVLTWLNTDDLLLPGALQEAFRQLRTAPGCEWLLGNVICIDSNDRILKCWLGEGYTPGWHRLGLLTAGGPSAFFTSQLYQRVGGLNTDLHYQMDTDLWWRFAIAGNSFRRMKGYTWALRIHPDAKTSGHIFGQRSTEEQTRISAAIQTETLHLLDQISDFLIGVPRPIASMLGMARRLSSPDYMSSRIDQLRFRGKPLAHLLHRTPAVL